MAIAKADGNVFSPGAGLETTEKKEERKKEKTEEKSQKVKKHHVEGDR